ncbi:MAG: tetratricopeptide repeat protein [Methanosarcina flavescens]|jgi:tetratricopeptide (TPR) repeat protein|uniref:Tetratricopeptide repeat protein n=1 Tax=Methanosarcina flavescens TaxID=1715806 RepID=A0A660HVL1_9EURY|nr:tetratricopeptide repeat protein [Methanosarcina flavescens]AYK16149.1 tetratricopeptide repeat protein [Methanosarcina flavescens]NLK31711.1 tetratricopeptide repeat protein [Methanosarcina flavescens]
MALHPTDYFRKERVFVDRETCIDNFKNFIQNPNQDYNALFYYGIAGIGKSKLQRELQSILDNEYPDILWVSMDLENEYHRNVSTFLVALRDKIQIKQHNMRFYRFNLAHAIFSKKSQPEIPLKNETYPIIKEDGFFYDILNALNETVFGSFLSIPVKRILDIINNAPENTLKFLKELPIDIKKLESMEAHEIEKILPGIFAADFTSNLGTNSRVCIFIDTYEAIWKDWRGVGSFSEKDKWIRKCLIPNMPGVSWVICGREQIKSRWAEDEKDWEMCMKEYPIEDLSEGYSERFLIECGVKEKDIRDVIVKASEGVPYYLNLSVDTYEQVCRSKKPEAKDFAGTKKEVFEKFVKYLDKNEIRTLNVLSAPNSWDRNLFELLIKKFNPTYSIYEFSDLIKYSFVKEVTDGSFSLHQLMRKSLQEHQDPTYRKEVHLFLHNYYSNKIKDIDIKSITPEHEMALIEAYYHAKEALKFAELGVWVIKNIELFDKAGYWKTIYSIYEDFVEILKEKVGSENIYLGIFMRRLAFLNEDRGRYKEAISYYQQVLKIFEKNIGKKILENNDVTVDDHSIAMVSNDLANCFLSIGEYEKALTLQQKVLKIVKNIVNEDPLYIALVQQNMANTYQYLGQYKRAMELCQEALNVREARLGEEDLEVAITLENLAAIHQHLGNYEKAFSLAQRALNIREKKLGPKHPHVAKNLSSLGVLCTIMGNLEEALKYNHRAVEIAEERLEEDHIGIAQTLSNLGATYQYMLRYDNALETYLRALQITEHSLGSDNPMLVNILNNIAETYRKMENYEKALEFYQRALNIANNRLGKEHPDTALILSNIGRLYIDKREFKKAHSICQQALDIRGKTLGTDHVDYAITLQDLGCIYGYVGRGDYALPLFERSLQIFENKLGTDHIRTKEAKRLVDTLKELKVQVIKELIESGTMVLDNGKWVVKKQDN